ncbi:tail fiber protein [Salmonella enterica]|nr:tail fiber protein [Salmonella enterica]
MKPLMKPIDTPDQVFHDGDPSTGELGTICSAEWLNDTQASIRDIQAECITILRANGLEPDETKRDQLWEAIQAAIKNHVPAASLVGAGIVQLSSSVTSDSETIAATLKAVKIAMDNGNARMAKDRNGSDIPNKALFRQNLELGNSATRNVGTTTGTVAAGDDVRITGAMQKAMNGSDIPDKAAFCRALGLGALATSDGIDALIKSQNGADIPDKALFVQNLGLTETVSKAAGAMQRDQNGADIPDKPLFVKTLGIVDSYPAGCPIPYPGPVAPDGYLLMDGRAFSKTLYPQLAKLYVDGVLPDMRGLYVRGWDNGRLIDVADVSGYYRPFDRTSKEMKGVFWPMNDDLYALDLQDSFISTGAVTPRGYAIKCKQPYTNAGFRFYEEERGLLSTQYYEHLMNNFISGSNQVYELYKDYEKATTFTKYKEPYFEVKTPTNGAATIEEVKKIAEEVVKTMKLVYESKSGYSLLQLDQAKFGSDEIKYFFPAVLKYHNLAPVGVPNVAFNYITKAA